VGIVAGRLAERYNKPAIVLSAPPGEMARGSARSIEGIDIHAAIAAHRDILHRSGGHPMAAGLSLEGERIAEFRRALWHTLEQTAPSSPEQEVRIDAVLTLDQISHSLVRAVNALSPFGPDNEAPILAARNLTLASSAVIGRTREHRRMVVRDREGRTQVVFWWQSADQPTPEGTFDLAFTVGINRFRGEENVQLTWIDAQITSRPAIEVKSAPTIAFYDLRQKASRLAREPAALQSILSAAGLRTDNLPLVWGEGIGAPTAVPLADRNAIAEAETLVVWTAPPGPDEFHAALERVAPRQLVLVGIDPELDALRPFLERLAGLIKYALREYGGRTSLSMLAGAMAHSTETTRLGLEWMRQQGQVDVAWQGDRALLLGTPRRKAVDVQREEIDFVQARLQASLQETAAYRAYWKQADARRLVNS
jgi:single-stranded-DNA-specific exonuclease